MVMTGFIKFSDKIRGYCLLNKRIFMVNILCSFFQIPPNPPFSKGGMARLDSVGKLASIFSAFFTHNRIKQLINSACFLPPFEKGGLGGISELAVGISGELGSTFSPRSRKGVCQTINSSFSLVWKT
jgi:hypothetical protein